MVGLDPTIHAYPQESALIAEGRCFGGPDRYPPNGVGTPVKPDYDYVPSQPQLR